MRGVGLLVGLLVLGLAAGLLAENLVRNRLNVKLRALDRRLAQVEADAAQTPPPDVPDWAAVRAAIAGQDALWRPLVAEETPPAAPPVLDKMLEGVVPTTRGIGSRVHIITPETPEGTLYGVGDSIHGLTIIGITRDEVEFSLKRDGQEYKTVLGRE